MSAQTSPHQARNPPPSSFKPPSEGTSSCWEHPSPPPSCSPRAPSPTPPFRKGWAASGPDERTSCWERPGSWAGGPAHFLLFPRHSPIHSFNRCFPSTRHRHGGRPAGGAQCPHICATQGPRDVAPPRRGARPAGQRTASPASLLQPLLQPVSWGPLPLGRVAPGPERLPGAQWSPRRWGNGGVKSHGRSQAGHGQEDEWGAPTS